MTDRWNRRRFLGTASYAAAGLVILRDSRSAWGDHANDVITKHDFALCSLVLSQIANAGTS